jgi:hypothetical protein
VAQQLLKCQTAKASRPEGPPDADANIHLRLEASARFNCINGFDNQGRAIAPIEVAERENGDELYLQALLNSSSNASVSRSMTSFR